jgi:hypothetical protein
MKARSYNARPVETLEGRTMMSAVAEADFNNDGRMDKAEVTSPTTITVSLAKVDGSYKVSATLTAPASQPIKGVSVGDYNHDGKLDITTGAWVGDRYYHHTWLGNGNGTFGNRITDKGKLNPGW